MTPAELVAYCEGKPGAWPDIPWGHEDPAFKVGPREHGKIFTFVGAGWNDLRFGGAIPDDELLEAVDESYRLVVSKLPRKHRPDS